MKVNLLKTKQDRGFTLIEMIGVLAVIAILAAVLIPKVFEAINNSRINNAAMSCQTGKTALVDHYAKFGSLAVDGTTTPPTVLAALPVNNFDATLMKEQFLDKPFTTKIGLANDGTPAGSRIDLLSLAGVAATVAAATDGTSPEFNLGAGGATNDIFGSVVAVAIIPGCTENDARDLSLRIDGETMSTAVGTDDLVGRVKYTAPATGTATTTVYVYLTHR